MTARQGLVALLIFGNLSCAHSTKHGDAMSVSVGMTVREVKATIAAARGEYHEFAYHYPGEREYFRFFSLGSGQVVVATVRCFGKDLSDEDIVAGFLLPPKTFSYSKQEFVSILEKGQYAVLSGLEVGTRD